MSEQSAVEDIWNLRRRLGFDTQPNVDVTDINIPKTPQTRDLRAEAERLAKDLREVKQP